MTPKPTQAQLTALTKMRHDRTYLVGHHVPVVTARALARRGWAKIVSFDDGGPAHGPEWGDPTEHSTIQITPAGIAAREEERRG